MFEQIITFSASADKLQWPNYFPKEPPSIYNWLCRLLMGQDVLPFPYLTKVSQKTKNIIAVSTLKKFRLFKSIISQSKDQNMIFIFFPLYSCTSHCWKMKPTWKKLSGWNICEKSQDLVSTTAFYYYYLKKLNEILSPHKMISQACKMNRTTYFLMYNVAAYSLDEC